MTLADLTALVAEAEEEELPTLVGQLASAHAMAFARLVAPKPPAPTHDENVSCREGARRLGISASYLYKHPELPFLVRIGGRTVCSVAGLEKFIRQRMKARG